MKDQRHYAGRFSAEVDRILEQHGQAEEQGPTPEYPALLTLAEQLAAIDPSQHTPLRPRLRAELLNQLDAKIAALTGLKENNVAVILYRAMRKLRQALAEGSEK